jgi:hypothetical protein
MRPIPLLVFRCRGHSVASRQWPDFIFLLLKFASGHQQLTLAEKNTENMISSSLSSWHF